MCHIYHSGGLSAACVPVHVTLASQHCRQGVRWCSHTGRTLQRDLEASSLAVIPDQGIGQPEGKGVHGARGGDTDVPQSHTSWPVLHGGVYAGADDLYAMRCKVQALQELGGGCACRDSSSSLSLVDM